MTATSLLRFVVPAAVAASALTQACLKPRQAGVPARAPDPVSVRIYRAVAESIYVNSTDRAVAIGTTSMDSTCQQPECPALIRRWALEAPAWWDSTESDEAVSVRENLVARSGTELRLEAVAVGRPRLIALPNEHLPSQSADTVAWIRFRNANGNASGTLRFSPVGISTSGTNAVVVAAWRCGPVCGHSVSVHLRRASDTVWVIAGVLLISRISPAEGR